MQQKFFLIFCFLITCVTSFSQDYRGKLLRGVIQEPVPHYLPEYTFDSPVDAAAWAKVIPGMHVSFATTDNLYFRTEVPNLTENLTWEETGWKGQQLNTQILVWSADSINQVRITTSSLINKNGQALYKENLNLHLVRYVVSNYPYNATNTTCDVAAGKDLYLMPDRFDKADRVDLPGKTVRPFWLSITIPQSAAPGAYMGTIEVLSEKQRIFMHVSIHVQNQVLPAPHNWSFRLDLWQNPWIVAWYNRVEPWSPEHKAMLKKHLALYASAGGKFITAYAVHSPWSDNAYMIEETMIDWIKKRNGAWAFDYSIFDQYVTLAMEAGIDKAITIYTPVPWGNRFRYRDEATGNFVFEQWVPGTDSFARPWNAFLTDLKRHLIKKGWLNITYLGINENTMEQTLATIKVIRAHSKDWKITYAGNWHKELDGLLNDYSFLYGNEPTLDETAARRAHGNTSTYYICCNPPKPNDFLFSPPAEGRWLGWYAAAHGYNGFLRWAYDTWPADPSRDGRHTLWPAGDCFLVYPGANSGTRFEKLKEGIVDFEKIRILKLKASGTKNKQVSELLKSLDAHLAVFLAEKEFNTEKIIGDLQKGKEIVNQLSDLLGRNN